MSESEPHEHALPGYNWSLKKLRRWVEQIYQCEVSRNTLRQILQQANLSWQKCQKVLKKAKPKQRAEYIQQFQTLFQEVCDEKVILLYVDEAHFHRDMDLGFTWSTKGKPALRLSDCPPLSDRINWYGAYDFTHGQALLWHEGSCNSENSIQFLQQLARWLGPLSVPVVLVWDGAPWHRAQIVQQAAADLGFTLVPLPAYSPDLNPIEGLWKWMREEVSQNHCYKTMSALFQACMAFLARINANPLQLISRLWPKFELDPEFEKLLLSN